jgi:hypothetical protein
MPTARTRIPAAAAAKERLRRGPVDAGPATRAAETAALPPMNLVGYGLDRTREGSAAHGGEPALAEAALALQQTAGNQAMQGLVQVAAEEEPHGLAGTAAAVRAKHAH